MVLHPNIYGKDIATDAVNYTSFHCIHLAFGLPLRGSAWCVCMDGINCGDDSPPPPALFSIHPSHYPTIPSTPQEEGGAALRMSKNPSPSRPRLLLHLYIDGRPRNVQSPAKLVSHGLQISDSTGSWPERHRPENPAHWYVPSHRSRMGAVEWTGWWGGGPAPA